MASSFAWDQISDSVQTFTLLMFVGGDCLPSHFIMISAALKRPALRSGSRAVSSVAAEFAAASNNMKQSLNTELESIFDDVQANVTSASTHEGSAAAAIGVPVAEEPLKPHHEGFFEARNQAEGTSVVEQESYSGAKLQNHFARDVNAFLANPPVSGGSFDVAAAAEKHGLDAASALKALGLDSSVLAQATPRLMADLCKLDAPLLDFACKFRKHG